MSDNKKYYYLKIKDSFFETEDMKILESMDNGYLYSNILMKLYLKSLKGNGRLMFKEAIPYNSKMLATITSHNIDVVDKAIEMFKTLGIIEILDNGAIYMLEIENFIGQSSSEADRIRDYRHKKEQEKANLLQMYDKCTPEIELELEKDLELNPPPLEKPTKITKKIYGEYKRVKLTDDEYNKLSSEWGTTELKRMIKVLDEGIEMSPTKYKYKNFNLALRKWKGNSFNNNQPQQPTVQPINNPVATTVKADADLLSLIGE